MRGTANATGQILDRLRERAEAFPGLEVNLYSFKTENSCWKGSIRWLVRVLGWVHVFLLNLFSCVLLYGTLWTVAHQATLSMRILQTRILEWVAMPSSATLVGTFAQYGVRELATRNQSDFWQWLQWGSVSSRGDLGSGLTSVVFIQGFKPVTLV